MIGPNRAAVFNRGRGCGCILNARTAAVRTEHDSSHFERTRSGKMNVKSIAGQLGERRARFALSSDSAHPLADHWSVSDFVALTKPRVMMLAVFTALVGLSSAPVRLDPLTTLAAVLAIAAGAGAAGVLNMWYDADIDAIMSRTAMRPIPRGKVSGIEPLTLFLIIFLWTPPHFWALALNRTDDYARAGVPMLPVVAGRAATTRQILIYSGLLVLASELPWVLGFAGTVYGVIVAICGALFLLLARQLNRSIEADRRAARRLFVFSIFYLFVLFAALLIDHGSGSFSPTRSSHGGRGVSVHAELKSGAVRGACCTVNFSEV